MVVVMTVVTGLAVMTMAGRDGVVTVTSMAVAAMAFGFGSRAAQHQGDGNQQTSERLTVLARRSMTRSPCNVKLARWRLAFVCFGRPFGRPYILAERET